MAIVNATNIIGLLFGLLLFAIGMKWIGSVKKRDAYKVAGISVMSVFVIFGLMMGSIPNFFGDFFTASSPRVPVRDQDQPQVANLCGSDGVGTLYARAEDTGASTLTYVGADVYALDTNGRLTPYSTTLGTSSPAWTKVNDSSSTTVPCGTSYNLVGVTSAESHASTPQKRVEMDSETVYADFDTYQLSKAQVFVKDLKTDSRRLLGYDNNMETNSSSSYVDLNQTKVTASAGADISVGADGYLDEKIEIKSGTANKYASEPNLPMFMCVNTGTDNEWQEPVISWNGAKLSSDGVKSSMPKDDLTGSLVAQAEWCYKTTDPIEDTVNVLNFYIKARSGQDPDTSNDDVTVSFLPQGRYKSNLVDAIKLGVYDDSSSQSLVFYSTETPTLKYQIQ